jgi:hypothetical protein
MRVLALAFILLAACGDVAVPPPADMAGQPDLVEPFVDNTEDSTGNPPQGSAYDPCQYAICNNPDSRVKYSDPAPDFLQQLPVH